MNKINYIYEMNIIVYLLMSAGKQHHISILDEKELNNITTYLKGNIHVKYYV